MEKISKRNIFTALINSVENNATPYFEREDGTVVTIDGATLAEFARHEIELIDKHNVKASERKSKANENDPLYTQVLGILTDEPQTISDIAAQVDVADATVSKIVARLTKMVKANLIKKEEVSIKNEDTGKANKVKAYSLI